MGVGGLESDIYDFCARCRWLGEQVIWQGRGGVDDCHVFVGTWKMFRVVGWLGGLVLLAEMNYPYRSAYCRFTLLRVFRRCHQVQRNVQYPTSQVTCGILMSVTVQAG